MSAVTWSLCGTAFWLWTWAGQSVACNTVKAHTICLDMTIIQSNYWLVYRRLSSKLMFSRHACPTSHPSLSRHTHSERRAGKKRPRATLQHTHTHTHGDKHTHPKLLTDTANKLSFKLMFSVYSLLLFLYIFLYPHQLLSFVQLSPSSLFFLCGLYSRLRAHLSNQYWQCTSRKPSWLNISALNQSDQQQKRLLPTEADTASVYS